MSKGLDQFMKGTCKGSKPEGTQLFVTTVQKAIITEGAETTSALSETASKTNSENDIRSFSEGEGCLVGMAVDWARLSDCTATTTTIPCSRI